MRSQKLKNHLFLASQHTDITEAQKLKIENLRGHHIMKGTGVPKDAL